jgi:uncharacterized small protein (DUF1192 family)
MDSTPKPTPVLNQTAIARVTYFQAIHKAGDHIQPAGTCDRCGASILHVFQVHYRDGSKQDYGSECINKILAAAPSMRTLFNKNVKLLKRYQDYLAILSGPVSAMPRGQEYFGSGLYFIADSNGKDILFDDHFLFHPEYDAAKNIAGGQYLVNDPAARLSRVSKEIEQGIAKLTTEIARLEVYIGRVVAKAGAKAESEACTTSQAEKAAVIASQSEISKDETKG